MCSLSQFEWELCASRVTHLIGYLLYTSAAKVQRNCRKIQFLLRNDPEGLVGELCQTSRRQKCILREHLSRPSFEEGPLFQWSPALSVLVILEFALSSSSASLLLLCRVTGGLTPASLDSLVIAFGPDLANRKPCRGTGGWGKAEARAFLTLSSARGQRSVFSVAPTPSRCLGQPQSGSHLTRPRPGVPAPGLAYQPAAA